MQVNLGRMHRVRRVAGGSTALFLLGAAAIGTPTLARAQSTASSAGGGPEFVHVWATAMDTSTTPRAVRRGVVLLTIDVRDGSPTRGRVVHTLLAAVTAGRDAHHTEHALATDGILFANDFGAGRTYRFDLQTPGAPRLLGDFTTAGPFGYPHSFVRLPNGNVLTTFQRAADGPSPGGLVEVRRDGTPVRWASAAAPGLDAGAIQPYSLEVIPALDRVVITSTSMVADIGVHVQIWRLSDLTLLHTIPIPEASPSQAAAPHAGHGAPADSVDVQPRHLFPGEPRLLADGRTVMLGTFTCGLYRLTGIDGDAPRLEFTRAFPGRDCAVPLRIGQWWIQTVPADRSLIALDVTDPSRPREAARLAFAAGVTPHWLAADASGTRLVMTSGSPLDARLHLVRFDPATGTLAPDATLPAVDLSRVEVAGLGVVRIVPHGSVFGPDGVRP